MVNDIKDLVHLIANRDGISVNEAWEMVQNCQDELHEIISADGSYGEATDAIAYWLGLEPDYLDILLWENR